MEFEKEVKPMINTIENAIKLLAEKVAKDVGNNVKSEDALNFSQAALNLTHVLSIKINLDRNK